METENNTDILINQQNLAVRHAASKDESRSTIMHVAITEDLGTVATNGRSLYKVNSPAQYVKDFPGVRLAPADAKPLPGTILPMHALVKAMKNKPSKTNLKVLDSIRVERTAQNLHLHTTDLETTDTVTVKEFPGEFPAWAAVMPDPKKQQVKVSMAVEQLDILVKVLKDFYKGHTNSSDEIATTVIFGITDSAAGIEVTAKHSNGQNLIGVIMPLGNFQDGLSLSDDYTEVEWVQVYR